MFGVFRGNCGVVWHRFFVLISTVCSRLVMSVRRIDSFKWIRDYFYHRANPHNSINSNSNNNNNHNNGNNATRPPEGEEHVAVTTAPTPATAQLSNNNRHNQSNNDDHLAEVVVVKVVNDTKIDATSQTTTAQQQQQQQPAATATAPAMVVGAADLPNDSNGNEATLGRCNTAPIAREEEAEMGEDDDVIELKHAVAMQGEISSNANCCGITQTVDGQCGSNCNSTSAKSTSTKRSTAMTPHEVNETHGASAVQRSKSRVRTYLQKCKQRLTGQQQQQQLQPQQHMDITHEVMKTETPPTVETVEKYIPLRAVPEHMHEEEAGELAHHQSQEHLEEGEDEENSHADAVYEDIDFSLTSTGMASLTIDSNEPCAIAGDLAVERVPHTESIGMAHAIKEQQLANSIQMESGTSALIDSYLSGIYPVYVPCTRAILIRQARDLLVCSYYGCLQTFEQKFLCKFAEIAAELKQQHATGENLLWNEGWPLTTPTGEVVLHLGALDSALVRPADIYLCVCTADNSDIPQLHVVWRTTQQNAAIIQRRCIADTELKRQHLSALTLEMLSDELPQLLQNLLVGVEHSIERVSLNELQMPQQHFVGNDNDNHHQHQHQNHQQSSTVNTSVDASNYNNNNNNNINMNSGQHLLRNASGITNSPKCALRRSELITKNKMLNNKFMLRRLTNRQDSMNSTSSGNSCGSSGSASSDELLLQCNNNNNIHNNAHNKNNNNNNANSGNGNGNGVLKTPTGASNSATTSPALPMFCLGNSFPHIDSDEENADEKRSSMSDDQFECEIVPPSSISEIPEKLLTMSGIYLPGTRDLKGQPVVYIDAEYVLAAGLNCYEIATVLLFYSTITERTAVNFESSFGTHANDHTTQLRQPLCNNSSSVTTTAAAINAPTANMNGCSVVKTPAHTYNMNSHSYGNTNSATTFTILIAIEKSSHMCVIDLICQSLKLLTRQIAYCEILAVCLDQSLLPPPGNRTKSSEQKEGCSKEQQQQQTTTQQSQQQQRTLKFISVDEVTTSVAPSQIPYGKLPGLHHHDARKWREFFTLLEPLQCQCATAGQRLVAAMRDIRSADLQGLPTRRQLYAQHRALSRALMDSELHNLRKRGAAQLARLQELAKNLNQPIKANNNSSSHNVNAYNNNNNNESVGGNNNNNKNNSSYSFITQQQQQQRKYSVVTSCLAGGSGGGEEATMAALSYEQCHNNDAAIRLHKVTLLFNEVDRAAKRLEQLTEQRRERLRELTRQRALEDEINEVTSWITSDGNETLQRFTNLQLDCETAIKEQEQEFEKYYFISMKHLAKGRDLYDAAVNDKALHESAANLKSALDCFAEKLELAHERIESAIRLHHLLEQHQRDEQIEQELQRLAARVGVPGLLEKCRQKESQQHQEQEQQQQQQQPISPPMNQPLSEEPRTKPNSLNLNCSQSSVVVSKQHQQKPSATVVSSTPAAAQRLSRLSHRSSSGIGSFDGQTCHCWRESRNLEDMDELLDADGEDDEEDGEEEQSKIADSGVGGCERCEGNPKLSRICSCQSLNEAANLYDKSNNSDELDFECYERPAKRYMDIHSPIEANAHLQYHASSLELSKLEELSCLDPKIQKTLLLIMREMIVTERDYVHSLYYVIENYVDELLRDDLPQPLRGQRNVIFGNIEKIFEFHKWHFLNELERYERNPLKVGSAFLQMESKFYLYALYNKNKPKSDTLMSEYGTAFFKSKQFELNDKMDLASYLLKPVQRMGKYALLLQQLVKACSAVEGAALQEIAADVEELQRAEEMVKFQLRHGNDLLAMDSLRDCDVNVKEQGRLLRQNEFLVWQGRGGKKSLRQVFLFEDLVLFSKARRFPDQKNLDIYIYKNSIKTSDIGLTAHVGDSPTKFEIWFRKRKPEDTWTLQCMSEDIKRAWADEISKLLWKQANRNREIRLAEMSSMGIGSKPCLDIRPSNNQISDRSITISQLGKAPKLRHSFAGMHTDPGKNNRRPNSLISESSVSSGTSSSSLSTGSSSGHERLSGNCGLKANNHHGLELINETQTLMLQSSSAGNNANNNGAHTNTLSSGTSSGCGSGSGTSGNARNHKRSTTLVSQLSMESGILSDISMTPDQEHPDASTSWCTGANTSTIGSNTVVMRRHRIHSKQHEHHCNSLRDSTGNTKSTSHTHHAHTQPQSNSNNNNSNPYLKEFKEESIHL